MEQIILLNLTVLWCVVLLLCWLFLRLAQTAKPHLRGCGQSA